MDDDGDGEVDIAEFCRWYYKTRGWHRKRTQRAEISFDDCKVHIRGIGKEGWNGTQTSTGLYENEAALRAVLTTFGEVNFVDKIRHRIDLESEPMQNTSYAIVTFLHPSAARSAVEMKALWAGDSKLTFELYTPNVRLRGRNVERRVEAARNEEPSERGRSRVR